MKHVSNKNVIVIKLLKGLLIGLKVSELNNKYDGSILTFLVTGVDKNGFEISEEIDINVWKVLVFINNKIR